MVDAEIEAVDHEDRAGDLEGGDPAQVGPPLLDAGATLFTVGTSGPDYDLEKVKQWIEWRNNL